MNIMKKQIKWIFSEYPWEKLYHVNGDDGTGEIIIFNNEGKGLYSHKWMIGKQFVADFLENPDLKKDYKVYYDK